MTSIEPRMSCDGKAWGKRVRNKEFDYGCIDLETFV